MFAMQLKKMGEELQLIEIPTPKPKANEVLIRVSACGVCRTDLHVLDGELPNLLLPIIPGHQIVGKIAALGEQVNQFKLEQRVGVPWLGSSCEHCRYCDNGQENLCDNAKYTGYQLNGGFAEYCVADANFCFPIPEMYSDAEAAPLLCAGLIGYRAYKKVENFNSIGIYGFGAAAHIITQVALYQQKEIYVFTRPGDTSAINFARQLGACWAGGSDEITPNLLDAAIIFAPVGNLVPRALRAVKKGGTVVCAGIHMSDIPTFPYHILWGEKQLCSIANLTRQDGKEFLMLAPKIPIKTTVHFYYLPQVNQALNDLREGRYTGAAVIIR